ncbi:hypothetical protein F5X99DRAFT_392949 [Biscogniauxia marginata]|nr:hypothetical protein F5X99DRAFT_392949 [Biscogniauxia marginata]
MGGVHKPGASFGAPMPMNTLNGNTQSHARPDASFEPRVSRPSPPMKRQKIEPSTPSHAHAHTQAQFVLSPEGPTDYSRPRKRSAESIHSVSDSQLTASAHSSNPRPSQSNVSEFRNSEKFVKGRAYKRPRHKAPDKHIKQHQKVDTKGALHEPPSAEDGMEVKGGQELDANKRPQNSILVQEGATKTEPSHNVEYYAARFKKSKNETRSSVVKELGNLIDKTDPKRIPAKSTESSEDELAIDDKEMAERVPYKRRPVPSSISRKSDIKPSKFVHSRPPLPTSREVLKSPDMSRAKEIISSPLRIVRGVSGNFKYQATEKSEADQCFLSLRQISTLLHPTDKDGNLLEKYDYLRVNLLKVNKILETAESCLVTVLRSMETATSSAPKLMLQFSSRDELEKFKQWITLERQHSTARIGIQHCPADRHNAHYDEMANRAKYTIVLRDSDQVANSVGDDVKLIEHNMEARSREMQRNPERIHGHTSRLKLKNTMGSSYPVPLSFRDNSHLAKSEDSRQHHHAHQVQVTRPARTRATFTLKSSPEPTFPEHEAWTFKNPGWENNWRNSLVFPAHGKNRAIVDKDDIHRLDEGQFLNDNLVIFYLRYLQDMLETERPDLARRIYFQNTFFYDKLKSTKTSQGINYDSVKTWTSKVDLFTKDYIIVPINEYTHWYVAIIYNAPKLLPSSKGTRESSVHERDSITIDDDVAAVAQTNPDVPRHNETTSDNMNSDLVISNTQNEVIDHLSRMSINSSDDLTRDTKKTADNAQSSGQDDAPSTERDKAVQSISGSDDSRAETEQIQAPSSNQSRKKMGKRHSTGPRKYNPDQTKIITLDSLGGSHSPACSILKQYLVAELKDKKSIEITPPGALGMTAKGVPEQSNHCDCGLYLLGYIQEFLKDPDKFVHSILQHDDGIDWNLDPSELRNSIRGLIFKLQKQQQSLEDASREKKRQVARLKKKEQSEHNGDPSPQKVTHSESRSDSPVKPVRMGERQDPQVDDGDTTPKPVPLSLGNTNDNQTTASKIDPRDSSEGEAGGSNDTPRLSSSSPKGQAGGLQTAPFVFEIGSPEEGSKAISRPKPIVSESRSETPQSPTNSIKGPHLPGAFPPSPARANGNKRRRTPSATTDSGEEIRKTFISPLGSPRSTGTPMNPMLVDDSETIARAVESDTAGKYRTGPQGKSPIAVVLPSTQPRRDHRDVIIEPEPRKQTTTQSRYFFAGRHHGDKMPSAKLREEPAENSIIDISD